jgi:Uma2 family endonuclease
MTIETRWTSADLARFPDDDALRYEIIDGELHVTKARGTYHQVVAGRIAAALDHWSTASSLGQAIPAPGIILPDEDNLIPDVVWISDERFQAAIDLDEKLHALPELIVEVLSPGAANVRRDREAKLGVYARGGVREYWIVDWPRRQLEVYRSDGADLQLLITHGETDTLTTPVLPGFALLLATVFARLPSR